MNLFRASLPFHYPYFLSFSQNYLLYFGLFYLSNYIAICRFVFFSDRSIRIRSNSALNFRTDPILVLSLVLDLQLKLNTSLRANLHDSLIFLLFLQIVNHTR